MIKKIILCICLLLSSSALTVSADTGVVYDPDVFYDIFFSGSGNVSFVMRRVKILEASAVGAEDGYIVVKSDKAFKDVEGRGYVFMRGVSAIVPSNYFSVEQVSK